MAKLEPAEVEILRKKIRELNLVACRQVLLGLTQVLRDNASIRGVVFSIAVDDALELTKEVERR